MKTFTKDRQIEILEEAKFPQGLTFKESTNVLMWTIFNPKKYWKYLELLDGGMHREFAYKEAKEFKYE